MDAYQHTKTYFERIAEIIDEILKNEEILGTVSQVAEKMYDAYLDNQQFFFCGNGGSWSTASHAYCDFMKGTRVSGKKRLRVISLTEPSLTTADANDDGYETVFRDPLEAHLRTNDVVTAISASGNSPNIVEAVEYANEQGATTIAWTAFGGGRLAELCDYSIVIPCDRPEYGPVEDLHLVLDHLISSYLRQRIEQEGPEAV